MTAAYTTDALPAGLATSVASLVGMPVMDGAGHMCGRVHEFVVDIDRNQTHVASLILRQRWRGGNKQFSVPVEELQSPHVGDTSLRTRSAPETAGHLQELLLLERDLVDQQIIDVDGHKVVRVNDVNLAWESGPDVPLALRVVNVEVGLRGASRRMLKGLPTAAVEGVAEKFRARVIPWEFVDLIDRDPARRVKLKIGQDRLAKLHPSDIADILEDLAPAEREAIFSSLPEETAAETLEEVAPRLQRELLEGLDSDKAADIVEEMDPAAAADLLAELSDEKSEAILEEMEPEERHDVEELLEHDEDTAAGRMTTDFVLVHRDSNIEDAVTALRDFDGDPDTITEVYLVDDDRKLVGVVPLARLIIANRADLVASLSEGHRVSCGLRSKDREVAELFDKYNLRSLPVLDADGRLAGTIHAEQVIAQLREG